MYELKKELTKEFILQQVPQEHIMERFLGVPVATKLFCSPLREDQKPTCSYFWVRDKLIYKDFGTGEREDCFGVVQRKYNIGFYEALKVISDEFKLDGTSGGESGHRQLIGPIHLDRHHDTSQKVIAIKKERWQKRDIAYWKSYNIGEKLLSEYSVCRAEHVFVGDKIVASYTDGDPCYAYYFGNGRYKVYFPKRDIYRFIGNTNCLQGALQLKPNGTIIITKSLKDVMCLRSIGYEAVAPQSENTKLNEDILKKLESRYKKIFLLYDNDKAGRVGASFYVSTPSITIIEVPESSGHKDISDYMQSEGVSDTTKLIKQLCI